MMKILKHAVQTKTIHTPYEFRCPECGCVFQTDEYTVGAERRPNGNRWFHINCPECNCELDVIVDANDFDKYIQTQTIEVVPNKTK